MWEFPGAEAIERWRDQQDVVEHMAALGSLADRVEEGVFELRVLMGG
jgi:hypothetical protein